MARGDHYFYVVTVNAKGNRVVIGPYPTDEQAEVDAAKSEYDAEVVKLKTKNLARATQMIKGRDYSEMGDINRATHFANHNAKTRTGSQIKSNDLLDRIRNTDDASGNLGGTPARRRSQPYDLDPITPKNGHNGNGMTSGFDSILENKIAAFDI